MLFNLVVHILAILTPRTKEDGQGGGLIRDLVEGGASIQHIDYCGTQLREVVKMKLISCFLKRDVCAYPNDS
jgi:hypothetical protein